jgi:peptidyl-prolyl cis-trans isomerase B (cyclophilin B)
MANSGQPDTGGSQFFVVYQQSPLLASYTVFGHPESAGLKPVQTMAKQGSDDVVHLGDGHPKVTVILQSVTAG